MHACVSAFEPLTSKYMCKRICKRVWLLQARCAKYQLSLLLSLLLLQHPVVTDTEISTPAILIHCASTVPVNNAVSCDVTCTDSIYQLTFQIIKHFKESLNFHLRWGENGKKQSKNMPTHCEWTRIKNKRAMTKKKNKNKNRKEMMTIPKRKHGVQELWNQQTRELISTWKMSHEHNSQPTVTLA